MIRVYSQFIFTRRHPISEGQGRLVEVTQRARADLTVQELPPENGHHRKMTKTDKRILRDAQRASFSERKAERTHGRE